MLEDLPLRSSAAPLLWLALPAIWLWGRYLAGRVSLRQSVRILLSPALAGASWVLAVHLTGRLSESFVVGVWAGSALVAALGLIGEVLRRKGEKRASREGGLNWKAMVLTAVGATLLISPMAVGFAFHDELLLTGHMSITAQMENGNYPPRHMTFPQFELRYHYAFNVMAATVSALTGLRLDRCLDAVSLALFFYLFCLLWMVGHRLAGPERAVLTPAVGLFGAGLMFLGMPADAPWIGRLLALGGINNEPYNPPALSYFFQHPWAAGLPWAVSALVLLGERKVLDVWRYVALALLLAALSIGQIVLFVTFAGALLVAEPWSGRRLDLRRAAAMAATAVVALLIARLAGGFLLPPIDEGASFALRTGVGSSPLVGLVWHLFNFGLLLPVGLVGLIWVRAEERVLLAVLALGSLAVINVLYYEHSWDIVKFANVASLALAIPASVTVARLLRLRAKAIRLLASGLVLAALLFGGLGLAASFAFWPQHVPEIVPRTISPPSGDDAQAIAWLRPRVRAGEIVYRKLGASLPYGQWGGLALPFYDDAVPAFGFSQERLDERYSLLRALPNDPRLYLEQGIRWFVLDPDDRTLSRHAEGWVASGAAREAAAIGQLRIFRLTAPVPAEDTR